MVIWIIDDDVAILNMLSIAGSRSGHQTEIFMSPLQALAALNEPNMPTPDVVFLDWTFPDGPPLVLAGIVQQKTRLIIMSGDPEAVSPGFLHAPLLAKPFSLRDFFALAESARSKR